ncbi:MAG: hypothetical protein AUK44_05625 [Porphyromonadaceae bacterium CG2_30_38_12]|nr:MAG: hypothetical protein AUK44_05625 [Porphyromonadaceae bacterium CG2_30_38_12]
MKKPTFLLFLQFAFITVFAQNWTLKWSDEFNNPTVDVTNTWNIEVNGNGGGNSELQYYRSENLSIENYQGFGCMVLNAKKENYLGKEFTSARVNTLGKVHFQYGKIETRMKIPSTANGLWPAFWLMGNDFNGSNWPACGEIDVMECGHSAGIASGTQSSFMGGALHWGPVSPQFIHYMDYTGAAGPYSIQDDFHLFTLIWTADSIQMYLDLDKFPRTMPFYQKKINADAPQQIYNYFHKPFHLLYNLAVGGPGFTGIANAAGVTAVPTDGTPVKMYIDYIRVYQKGEAGEQFHSNNSLKIDTNPPTNLTASVGAITQTSVEFLLNGTDDSGSVIYTISFNGTNASNEALSGSQKSFIVSGLMPGTTYNFSVTAKDATQNISKDASIILNAKTLASSECEGISNVASQGTFSNGYAYSFSTSGNSVIANFEMLDSKEGVVAYLWDYTSGFAETQMTNVGGKKFSITLNGKTAGATLKLACKFAFAGGMSVTKQYSYVVGNNCDASSLSAISANNLQIYPNPVDDTVTISANNQIDRVLIINLLGQTLKTVQVKAKKIIIELPEIQTGHYLIESIFENGHRSVNELIKN